MTKWDGVIDSYIDSSSLVIVIHLTSLFVMSNKTHEPHIQIMTVKQNP